MFDAQTESRANSPEAARNGMIVDSPLRRLVPPRDVAAAIMFLAGDAASVAEDLNVSAGIVTY